MSNKVMGEIPLNVAGTERTLQFTFETFEEIGQQLGLEDFNEVIQRIVADLNGSVKMRTFWIMLAAALRPNWPEVDVADLRRAFQPRDLKRVGEAMMTAFQVSLPDEDAEAEAAASGGPPEAAAA